MMTEGQAETALRRLAAAVERVVRASHMQLYGASYAIGRGFQVIRTEDGEQTVVLTATEEWMAGALMREEAEAISLLEHHLRQQFEGDPALRREMMIVRHTGHVRYVCRCGAVQSQCRCMGPKTDVVACETCPQCEGQDTPPPGANEPLESQIDRLGQFLLEHYPREIGRGFPGSADAGGEGAVDVAIRLLTPGGSNPAPAAAGPDDWSGRLAGRTVVQNFHIGALVGDEESLAALAEQVGQRIADDLNDAREPD